MHPANFFDGSSNSSSRFAPPTPPKTSSNSDSENLNFPPHLHPSVNRIPQTSTWLPPSTPQFSSSASVLDHLFPIDTHESLNRFVPTPFNLPPTPQQPSPSPYFHSSVNQISQASALRPPSTFQLSSSTSALDNSFHLLNSYEDLHRFVPPSSHLPNLTPSMHPQPPPSPSVSSNTYRPSSQMPTQPLHHLVSYSPSPASSSGFLAPAFNMTQFEQSPSGSSNSSVVFSASPQASQTARTPSLHSYLPTQTSIVNFPANTFTNPRPWLQPNLNHGIPPSSLLTSEPTSHFSQPPLQQLFNAPTFENSSIQPSLTLNPSAPPVPAIIPLNSALSTHAPFHPIRILSADNPVNDPASIPLYPKLIEELIKLRAEKDKKIESLESTISNLKKEIAIQKNYMESIPRKFEELKQELSEEKQKINEEKQKTSEKNTELSQKIINITKEWHKSETQKRTYQGMIDDLTKQNMELKKKNRKLERQVRDLQEKE